MYIICVGLEKKLPGRASLTFQLIISEKNQDFEMVTSNFDLVSTFFPSVVETTHETLKVLKYCV